MQFYFCFKKAYRLTTLKKLHPTCKLIACDGIPDTVVTELGNLADACGPKHAAGHGAGARADLEAFKDAVKGGMLNVNFVRTIRWFFAKYGAFVRSYV